MTLRIDIEEFSYQEVPVLKDIHLELAKGEHIAILGESGCGKSTLLHLIYGLLHLEKGSIYWGDKELLGPNFNLIPGEEFMKLVAQDPNVMPYTKVSENVATHLSRINLFSDQKRVKELLRVVSLEDFSETMVKHLSGGQKQRVALAKSLAKTPKLLLLDEPFSHIDSFKKNQLRRNLFEFLKKEQISCITATHDAEEALAFSDRILMLKGGIQERLDHPEKIFNHPENTYQASFFGEVTKNIPASGFPKKFWLPHEIKTSKNSTPIKATVKASYFKGTQYVIHAVFKEKDIFFNHSRSLEKESQVFLKFKNT